MRYSSAELISSLNSMNTKQQLAFAWTLVAVLAVLLAIAGYFLSGAGMKNQNITEKRDLIREHCGATDAASKEQCARDLQDLSDLLRDFGKDMAAKATVKVNAQ